MTLCACGCGKPAGTTRRGQRYFCGHSARSRQPKGYRQVGRDQKWHRVLAERAVGHSLPPSVEVHHVDGDIDALNPRLVICQDKAYHKLLHVRAEIVKVGGDPNVERQCGRCKELKPFECFKAATHVKSTGRSSICRTCTNAAIRARKAIKRMVIAGVDCRL